VLEREPQTAAANDGSIFAEFAVNSLLFPFRTEQKFAQFFQTITAEAFTREVSVVRHRLYENSLLNFRVISEASLFCGQSNRKFALIFHQATVLFHPRAPAS
jgi:hypothetical protein